MTYQVENDYPLPPAALLFLGGVGVWDCYVAAWRRWHQARPDLLPHVRKAVVEQVASSLRVEGIAGYDAKIRRAPAPASIILPGGLKIEAKIGDADREMIREIFAARLRCRQAAFARMKSGEIEILGFDTKSLMSDWRVVNVACLFGDRHFGDRYLSYGTGGRFLYRIRETQGSAAEMAPFLYAGEDDAAALRRLIELGAGVASDTDFRWPADLMPLYARVGPNSEPVRAYGALVVECQRMHADFMALNSKVHAELLVRLGRGELIATGTAGVVSLDYWWGLNGKELLDACEPGMTIRSALRAEIEAAFTDRPANIEGAAKRTTKKPYDNQAVFKEAYEMEKAGMRPKEVQNKLMQKLKSSGNDDSKRKIFERGVAAIKREAAEGS